MTKEEAAKKLQRESKVLCYECMHPQEVGWCKNHCQLPEAFDMAIKALTNTSNTLDTIYRQAAIDEIEERISANNSSENAALISELNKLESYILHLPPAQSERKKGKWISLDDFRGKYNEFGYKCSECNEQSDYEENFCPNCGCKMEVEE